MWDYGGVWVRINNDYNQNQDDVIHIDNSDNSNKIIAQNIQPRDTSLYTNNNALFDNDDK